MSPSVRWSRTPAGASMVHAIAAHGQDLRLTVAAEPYAWDIQDRPTGRYGVVLSVSAKAHVRIDGPVGEVSVEDTKPTEPIAFNLAPGGLIIALAVHNPKPELLRRQVASLQAQTHTNWRCAVLDAGSRDPALVRACLPQDQRFVLARSAFGLGAPRDFMRLLAALPPTDAIALCDQDDVWRPDKIERTLAALTKGAVLAYCDMRLVAENGVVIAPTFWTGRVNNWTDPWSLMFANTVTGAASILDPRLLELALPFPETLHKTYHDQWLALCALGLGEIVYVPHALYDYVQHAGQDIGHRPLRYPPWIHDSFNLWRVAEAGLRGLAGLPRRSDCANALEADVLRLKHLALTLEGRLKARGAPIPAAIAAMAQAPRNSTLRMALLRRGLASFGRPTASMGNDLRLLAAML